MFRGGISARLFLTFFIGRLESRPDAGIVVLCRTTNTCARFVALRVSRIEFDCLVDRGQRLSDQRIKKSLSVCRSQLRWEPCVDVCLKRLFVGSQPSFKVNAVENFLAVLEVS